MQGIFENEQFLEILTEKVVLNNILNGDLTPSYNPYGGWNLHHDNYGINHLTYDEDKKVKESIPLSQTDELALDSIPLLVKVIKQLMAKNKELETQNQELKKRDGRYFKYSDIYHKDKKSDHINRQFIKTYEIFPRGIDSNGNEIIVFKTNYKIWILDDNEVVIEVLEYQKPDISEIDTNIFINFFNYLIEKERHDQLNLARINKDFYRK